MDETARNIIRSLAGDLVEARLRASEANAPKPVIPDDLGGRLARAGFEPTMGIAQSFVELADRLCAGDGTEDRFTDLMLLCLDAPSPGTALTNLHRFIEHIGGSWVFLDTISQAPPLAEMLITIFGSSQYMAEILIRNPGYLYWLMDGNTWATPDTVEWRRESLRRETDLFRSLEAKLNAIRRAHRKALLKIGARDLLGEATIEETTQQLSNLAEAIVETVLEVVAAGLRAKTDPDPPEPASAPDGFAVIALGKLGGFELNYSSDIDLLYVCRDVDEEMNAFYLKVARALTTALSEVTAEGYFYRVDLRLRPDGQAGPLVNPETALRLYYENRGRPWEFQAMLKARVLAGDRELGKRLLGAISGLVFNPSLPYSPLEDIARMRAHIVESIPARERAFNIKLTSGGIRDIEFATQAFQLMHGGGRPELRTPNTLEALGHIRRLGLMESWQADNLSAAYRFFRLVEHRLQMMYQIKTHTVPESREDIALLAKRASKGPLGTYGLSEFLEALSHHLNNVRAFSDSLFAGEAVHPYSALLLLPEDDPRATAIIGQYGITEVRRAMHVLHAMAYGSFPRLLDRRTRAAFEQLLPYLLEDIAETGDPDQTLVNVAQIAEASRSESSFYQLLAGSPPARRRIVSIAGCSSYLTKRLCNQMEVFEPLIEAPEPEVELPAGPRLDRRAWRAAAAAPESRPAVQRRDRQRAQLDHARIVGFVRDHTDKRVAHRLPAMLTDAVRRLVVEAFDNVITEKERVALIALGSFAVGEPRLFSDLDVIVVSDGADIAAVAAEVQLLSRWFTDGRIVKLDFRLRGEGASSPLVQDVAFYRQYMERRISLWEKVAFAKCRHWWGGDAVAARFLELVGAAVARPFSGEEVTSLVQMRRSIETLAPRSHTAWETKRSAGGRYDIEYITAIGMAALPGGYETSLSTPERLALVRDHGLLDASDCDALVRALSLYNAIEYFLELQEYSLPRSDEKSRQLDLYMTRTLEGWGVGCPDGAEALIAATKQSVRACFERFVRNVGSDASA